MAETKTFDSWTSYDTWLVENYSNYSVIRLNEKDGTIVAEFINKGDPLPEE